MCVSFSPVRRAFANSTHLIDAFVLTLLRDRLRALSNIIVAVGKIKRNPQVENKAKRQNAKLKRSKVKRQKLATRTSLAF